MSFSTNKPYFIYHVTAIISACLIVVFFNSLIQNASIKLPSSGKYTPNIGQGVVATENLASLNSAMKHGDSVVVFGSSELTSQDLKYIPYHFLPRSLHIPTFAYGHAYFQSFGIEGVLRANANALSEKTKLVILVSPGWFKVGTMPLDSFLEHFQPQVLTNLYQDDVARSKIKKYLEEHKNEFGSTSIYQNAFIEEGGGQSYTKYEMFDSYLRYKLFDAKTRMHLLASDFRNSIHDEGAPPRVLPDKNQWSNYNVMAKKEELDRMSGNKHWVRDDYFHKYLSDMPEGGLEYFPKPFNPNSEYENLVSVLKYLQEKQVHALIVMQPLNPYVYNDAGLIRPIGKKLAEACAQTGMNYLDMSAEDYVPGTLRDGMHLGELGWVQVDKRIVESMKWN